ncbi:MAG: BNR-4 repeat-containing protein [Cyclobacteriaceae bacterium]
MERNLDLYSKSLLSFLVFVLALGISKAQVTLEENSLITDEALYFWKADDDKPYHYGAYINPHGNCVKVANGYVFYTWYKGGFADRQLMVSRKKIGSGEWVHVGLPGKMSLVGGKGDTHLTTNIGISSVDGTVHIMYDHHNEDLNYIRSKKNIAFAEDSEFHADNFLPQQDYLVSGKKVTGVTYPDMFNNDAGEMFFERRKGSAVGGNVVMTYYDGERWSEEVTLLQGTGAEVTQGERNFCYGSAASINGDIYYTYSVRWAESPTRLNEGVYLLNAHDMKAGKATNVFGETYDLPIIDHRPFFIADPRSVPTTEGWAGGPQVAISPKNDVYLKISPKNTTHYNYLKTEHGSSFSEDRGKGTLGVFYGNRMYKFEETGGFLRVLSAGAGTYDWRTDYELAVDANFTRSKVHFQDGYIVAVFAEAKASDKIPIHCFAIKIEKSEYTPQTINFESIASKVEGDMDFSLNATATSKLPVSFISSDPKIARITADNKVKIVGVGTCNIIASQTGDGIYDAAPNVERSLTVAANTSKTNQTIDFSLASATYTWGSGDLTLVATSSSGLPVSFESSDTSVAIVADGRLRVKRAGTSEISAIQLGNSTFNAAPIICHVLQVPKQPQVLTFEEIPSVVSGSSPFTLNVTSNNPDAELRYVCPNNQVAVVWENSVRQVLGSGTATITVSESGNEYFEPAQLNRTLTVTPKTHAIPAEIEAEHYTSKQGVNVVRWSNTVFYLNDWGTGDYAEYTIDVPEAGTYPVEIRAATPTSGRKMKIMTGDKLLTNVTLTTTPNLTSFRTTQAAIELEAGVQNIKIVAVVGGYNFDWMKILEGETTVDPDTTGGNEPDQIEPGDYTIAHVDGEQSPNFATNLFDGNTADDARWSAKGYPKSVTIDLGEEKGLIGTRMWTYEKRAYQYHIEVADSLDGEFIEVVNRSSNTATAQPLADTFEIQKCQFVKLIVVGCHNYSSDWVSINELQMLFDETDSTTDENEVDSSSIEIVTGLPMFDNEHLVSIYPNPTSSTFKVDVDGMTKARIRIFDLLGSMIYDEIASDQQITLPRGIYLVKIKGDNREYLRKLIVR